MQPGPQWVERIAVLIEHELALALGDSGGGVGSVFAHHAEERMAEREAKLVNLEAELKTGVERPGG